MKVWVATVRLTRRDGTVLAEPGQTVKPGKSEKWLAEAGHIVEKDS